MIRPATVDDLPLLPVIERAAGELFRPLGMDAVADDEPPDPAALRRFVDAGRAWVAERPSVVAYLLAEIVDGCAYVEQVTVHPAHAGHRIGAALLEALGSWAARRGLPALTLTTFRHVPWNGPYYRRLGFRWIDDHEIGPGLRAVRDIEIARGLDRWSRGCMRRDLRMSRGQNGRQGSVSHGIAIMSRRSSSTSRPTRGPMSTHPILRQTVLDAVDARELAEFYRRLLGLAYRPGDEPPADGGDDAQARDWLVLRDAGGPRLAVQPVPALPAATWPEGNVPQMLHLDLTVPTLADLHEQHARVLALGGRELRDRSDDAEEPLYVYADPAGHPFCVFVAAGPSA